MLWMSGSISQTMINYEHVTVTETRTSNRPFDDGTIAVVFKGGGCETASVQ